MLVLLMKMIVDIDISQLNAHLLTVLTLHHQFSVYLQWHVFLNVIKILVEGRCVKFDHVNDHYYDERHDCHMFIGDRDEYRTERCGRPLLSWATGQDGMASHF